MEVIKTAIEDVVILKPRLFTDAQIGRAHV